MTLFCPQRLLRSLDFFQLGSFLLRRSVGFLFTIYMKLPSYKNGEDRRGTGSLAVTITVSRFISHHVSPLPPLHLLWVAAFSAYLNYPLENESLPSPTACTRASTAASVFSDIYYFLNIYHLFHKSLRRNGKVCSWSAILNQKPPTPIAFSHDQLSQIFS